MKTEGELKDVNSLQLLRLKPGEFYHPVKPAKQVKNYGDTQVK